MDDIIGKLGELLSDEESVQQLTELAQMMMSGDEEGSGEGSEETSNGEGMHDLGAVMKIAGLAGALSQKDKNAELLLALKPHLSEERQKKVDKAVKLLKLIAIWNMAKENGLLSDLL